MILKKTDNGNIQIKWNSVRSAPEEILDLLSCNCSIDCKATTCPCIRNNLGCTDACHAFDCANPNTTSDDTAGDFTVADDESGDTSDHE